MLAVVLAVILNTDVVAAGQKLPPEPRWLIAHTGAPDGSAESIAVEFTMPHGAPQVVGKIVRWVSFANNAPVAVPNLIDALKKKYGATESLDDNGHLSGSSTPRASRRNGLARVSCRDASRPRRI